MKNYTLFIYSILLLLAVTSCELNDFEPTEWAIDPELELEKSGQSVSSAAKFISIGVTTNYNEFYAKSSEKWCSVVTDIENKKINISESQQLVIKNQLHQLVYVEGGTFF